MSEDTNHAAPYHPSSISSKPPYGRALDERMSRLRELYPSVKPAPSFEVYALTLRPQPRVPRQLQDQMAAQFPSMFKPWKRPSWDETGINLAQVWAQRSTDPKHQVGAVILSNLSHVQVSAGLNGRHPGCPTEDRASDAVGQSAFIHAEANALLRARWELGEKHTIFVTHEPCFDCALLILAARHISRVVYVTEYVGDGIRPRGSKVLEDAGVEVLQWNG